MNTQNKVVTTNIGVAIKVCAAQQGALLKDIAEHLGVSQVTMTNITHGRTDGGKYINQLAGFFNMSASEFVRMGEVKEK